MLLTIAVGVESPIAAHRWPLYRDYQLDDDLPRQKDTLRQHSAIDPVTSESDCFLLRPRELGEDEYLLKCIQALKEAYAKRM